MAQQRTRRRIEIGWFEALVLLIGYVASLGIVGVAGIYIGQRAAHQRLGGEERVIRLPISASGTASSGGLAAAEPKLTFYENLGKPEAPVREGRIFMRDELPESASAPDQGAPSPAARPEEPSPAQPAGRAAPEPATGPETPAPAGTASPEEKPAERPQQDVVEQAPPAVARREQPSPVVTPPAPRAGGGSLPAPRRSSPPPGVTPEAAATAQALLATARAEPGASSASTWSVQVTATKDPKVARSLSRRLRERGYDAYIVEQLREGTVWYRVRVGHLPTIDMANALVVEIKEREGLAQAFVASD